MKKEFFFQKVFDQEIEVEILGDLKSDNSTIVLLHEGLGSASMWKEIPILLHEVLGLNILFYSRAGYGKSSPVQLPRPINYMNIEAESYLPELLSKLHLNNVYLLGHSDGASIAAINTSLKNNKYNILGTILIAPHFFVEEMSLQAIKKIRKVYENEIKKKLSKYHNNVDIAFYGWNDVWLHPEFRKWDIRDFLSEIETPVLAIQGDKDPYGSLLHVEVLENKIKGKFDKLILKNCGHNPLIDMQKESINKIKEFILQIEKENN